VRFFETKPVEKTIESILSEDDSFGPTNQVNEFVSTTRKKSAIYFHFGGVFVFRLTIKKGK